MFDFIHPERAVLVPGHRDADDILPRTEWFAREPIVRVALKTPVSHVILTYRTGRFFCFDEPRCKRVLRDLQRRHLKDNMADIEYNFMVGGDGLVYEGRGWRTMAPSPKGYNLKMCLSIAYIGNFERSQPNKKMIKSTFRIINLAIQRNVLRKNYDLLTYRCHYNPIADLLKLY